MTITRLRAEEIGTAFLSIRQRLHSINSEEIQEFIEDIERDNAFGPLVDPSSFMGGELFKLNRKAVEFAKAALELKRVSEEE